MKTMTLKVELEEQEAMALAQFVKRVGWSETRANAANDGEAYLMSDAFNKLRKELAEEGYAPR